MYVIVSSFLTDIHHLSHRQRAEIAPRGLQYTIGGFFALYEFKALLLEKIKLPVNSRLLSSSESSPSILKKIRVPRHVRYGLVYASEPCEHEAARITKRSRIFILKLCCQDSRFLLHLLQISRYSLQVSTHVLRRFRIDLKNSNSTFC